MSSPTTSRHASCILSRQSSTGFDQPVTRFRSAQLGGLAGGVNRRARDIYRATSAFRDDLTADVLDSSPIVAIDRGNEKEELSSVGRHSRIDLTASGNADGSGNHEIDDLLTTAQASKSNTKRINFDTTVDANDSSLSESASAKLAVASEVQMAALAELRNIRDSLAQSLSDSRERLNVECACAERIDELYDQVLRSLSRITDPQPELCNRNSVESNATVQQPAIGQSKAQSGKSANVAPSIERFGSRVVSHPAQQGSLRRVEHESVSTQPRAPFYSDPYEFDVPTYTLFSSPMLRVHTPAHPNPGYSSPATYPHQISSLAGLSAKISRNTREMLMMFCVDRSTVPSEILASVPSFELDSPVFKYFGEANIKIFENWLQAFLDWLTHGSLHFIGEYYDQQRLALLNSQLTSNALEYSNDLIRISRLSGSPVSFTNAILSLVRSPP